MSDVNPHAEFKTKLLDAQSVLILLPPDPDLDSTNAALTLHHALSDTGKQTLLGCSTNLAQKYPDLEGVEVVKNHIGNQTLVVSFDYQEDAVENVSYDIDDATKKFNLRIQPRPNQAPLDVSKVSYSYTGAQADLVITFSINSLEELGNLYSEEKSFMDTATIANLVASPRPSAFATFNLNFTSPLAEAMALLIKELGLKLAPQSATNMLQTLMKSTNNFQSPSVNADTFELAAFLLRSGAQKTQLGGFAPRSFPFAPVESEVPDLAAILPKPQGLNPNPQQGVPADWSGPKIYRGGNPLK